MKAIKRVTYFSILFLLVSCGKSELKPSGLIQWVDNAENGLVKRQDFENYFFEAKYKPLDYIISMEARTDDLSKSVYNNLKENLKGLQYIDLDIGTLSGNGNAISGNTEDENEYYARLDYFVSYASYDIFMIQGNDTLIPRLYHFERNYGVAPKNTLLLGFDSGSSDEDRDLIIDDQVLGIGRVKFHFENKNISSTPKLKTI